MKKLGEFFVLVIVAACSPMRMHDTKDELVWVCDCKATCDGVVYSVGDECVRQHKKLSKDAVKVLMDMECADSRGCESCDCFCLLTGPVAYGIFRKVDVCTKRYRAVGYYESGSFRLEEDE